MKYPMMASECRNAPMRTATLIGLLIVLLGAFVVLRERSEPFAGATAHVRIQPESASPAE